MSRSNMLDDNRPRRVRPEKTLNVFRRFQQGSEVSYRGSKFGKELHNSKGVIDGFVDGSQHGVVVSFGTGPEDHYIMDELRDLETWKERPKTDKDKDKGPAVEKRKGVAKGAVVRRKGGASQEEAD